MAALYAHSRCALIAGGRQHNGFELLAGIRQGCPLSPLLIAAAVGVLLRRVQRLVPGAIVRAYADDVAVVLPAGFAENPTLVEVFEEFSRISGLRLNLPETAAVPLSPEDPVLLYCPGLCPSASPSGPA